MKYSNKMKQDLLTTYFFWVWAADTGLGKSEYPDWFRLAAMSHSCAFCEYFYCIEKGENPCRKCPLNKECVCGNTVDYNAYDFWVRHRNRFAQRKYYAGLIRDAIKEFLLKEKILRA